MGDGGELFCFSLERLTCIQERFGEAGRRLGTDVLGFCFLGVRENCDDMQINANLQLMRGAEAPKLLTP
jgi:hypothetical protein